MKSFKGCVFSLSTLFVLFSALFAWSLAFQPAAALDAPSLYVRDLVLDAESYPQGGTIRGKAMIVNEDTADHSGLNYVVRLVGKYSEDGIPGEEYTSKTDGPIFVPKGSSREITFTLPIPAGVGGTDLGIDVQVMLDNGFPLGWADQRISVDGTLSFAKVTSATVVINNTPYPVESGPVIRDGDSAFIAVSLAGATADLTLTPTLIIYDRSVSNGAELSRTALKAFTLASKGNATYEYELPLFEHPGVYAGLLTFADETGSQRVPTITFRYIIWGDIATIHSVSSDVSSGAVDAPVAVTVEYGGPPFDITTGAEYTSGPGTLAVRLFNESDVFVGEGSASIALLEDEAMIVPITLSEPAQALRAEVTITRNGTLLATMNAPLSEMSGAVFIPSTQSMAITLAVLLLALFIVYHIHRWMKARDLTATSAALALFICTSSVLMPFTADAYTTTINKWKPSSIPPGWTSAMINTPNYQGKAAATVFVNSPSGTLQPGQRFYVQGSVRSDRCSNTPQYLYIESTFQGTKKAFQRTMAGSGGEIHTIVTDRYSLGPYTAPTTPGTYRVYIGAIRAAGPMATGEWFTGGEYGYQEFTVPPQCTAANTHLSGNECVCDAGYVKNASGQCVLPTEVNTPPTSCPAYYTLTNGVCVRSSCPSGYVLDGSVCSRISCPNGYVLNGNNCVPDSDADGFAGCTLPPTCFDGTHIQNTCTEAITACGTNWSCSNGACIPPSPPSADIRAIPSLIRTDLTTIVSWTSENTVSCQVSEDNAAITDSWAGLSGSEPSGAIDVRTLYTLTCIGTDGSTLTDTAVVTVNPSWEEQ